MKEEFWVNPQIDMTHINNSMELDSNTEIAKETTDSAIDEAIWEQRVAEAEQCLIDNGIEPDEAQTVLQALGYILLDKEIYNEKENKK